MTEQEQKLNIETVYDAWKFYRKLRPEFVKMGNYYSKAKREHGEPGVTHIISQSLDGIEMEYLTRKSYWYDNCQKYLLDDSLLPREDRHPALADTIKTDMLNKMKMHMSRDFIVTHVTVMPDGRTYTFNADAISKYVEDHNTYLDHFYGGEKAAVFYPQRLANEFKQDDSMERWFH